MKQRTVENMKTKYHTKHGKRKNSLSHVNPKLLQGFILWWCSVSDTEQLREIFNNNSDQQRYGTVKGNWLKLIPISYSKSGHKHFESCHSSVENYNDHLSYTHWKCKHPLANDL